MASIGDLRGRVIITNGASGTLNQIKRDLSAVGAQSKRTALGTFTGNALASSTTAINRLQSAVVGLRGAMMSAGFAMGGIIATTKNFNESNFGYGFARITEFIKDGKLQLNEWKAAMRQAADEARKSSEEFGTTPDVTMKAREEVEKLGLSGSTSKSMYNAAMGLYLSEPGSLTAGDAAKFLNQVYQGYEKQRGGVYEKLAKQLGTNVSDPAVEAAYLKGLAAKTAVAAAASPLGPADTVEGMRQYAPLYAAMGIPFEFALAMLAHGSKYGFDAAELGTAYKSMANKAMNPTATGLRLLDARGIDRSQFMKMDAADPMKAVMRLNNLLDGQLFRGKGGPNERAKWIADIRKASEEGRLTSPEFQQELANRAIKRLGHGWSGRSDEVRNAVANSVMQSSGQIDLPGYIKALREAGVTIGEIAQIFEGRHVARNTPLFEFYEKLVALYDQLNAVDGSVIDALTEGRKASEAGKTEGLFGAWQRMVGAMENTGVISTLKDGLIGLMDAVSNAPSWALTKLTAGIAGLGVAAAVSSGVVALAGAVRVLQGALAVLGIGAVTGGAAAASGAGVGVAAGGAAAGVASTALGRKVMRGMSSAGRAAEASKAAAATEAAMSARLAAGMAEAGAAGAASGGLVARYGGAALRFGGKAISKLFWPLALGVAAWDAYEGYQKDGLKGAVLNPLTFGMFSGGADAAEAGGPPGTSTELPTIDVNQGGDSVASAQSMADQIRQVLSLDLSAEGAAAGSSFAAAFSGAIQGAVSAAQSAASSIRAATASSGQGVRLNTGPTMAPAR